MKKVCGWMLAAAATAIVSSAQAGEVYPVRAINIVVPYSPGGSSDATARLLAQGLGKVLGQSVVVENKPGAGGNIGAAYVAKARPDGYTLLFATSSHATNMTLYKSLNYDLIKDFAPVSLVSYIPNVLVVNEKFPAKNLKEFIDIVQSKKIPINYGSAGNGSSSHLAGALFNELAHGQMTHIPYKGGAPANQDLLAGRLQAVFAPMVEVLPFIESGRLRALGVTTPKRSSRLPDVPAIDEALPGYKAALWNSLMAPKGTDPAIVAKLAQAVKTVIDEPATKKILASQGTLGIASTPEDFAKLLPGEIKTWGQMVKISGATVE